MKKMSIFLLCLVLLSGCGGNVAKVPFDGMLDSDTGKVYKLGDSKDAFDEAFGQPSPDEKERTYDYIGDILTITFDENNCAVSIESSGKSNRFEFYDFNFDKPIKEIEGRYEKFDEATGYTFYTKYFDSDGTPCSLVDRSYSAQLMVRKGDMEILDLKDGEYVSYEIAKEE